MPAPWLPLALIVLLLAYPWLRRIGIGAAWLRPWERLCDVLRAWAIVDVYLLAIFVTVVKLAQLTDAAPGLGAAMLFAMVLCLTLALRNLDSEGPDPITAKSRDEAQPASGARQRGADLRLGHDRDDPVRTGQSVRHAHRPHARYDRGRDGL